MAAMKVMISQPMTGKSNEEIDMVRTRSSAELTHNGYVVLNTFFPEQWKALECKRIPALWMLSKAIEKMSDCDAVYFCKGWENSRGCIVEHEAAKLYKLALLYE